MIGIFLVNSDNMIKLSPGILRGIRLISGVVHFQSGTEEPQRTELYEKMEDTFASFSDYKKSAGRVIPVITLTRLD